MEWGICYSGEYLHEAYLVKVFSVKRRQVVCLLNQEQQPFYFHTVLRLKGIPNNQKECLISYS